MRYGSIACDSSDAIAWQRDGWRFRVAGYENLARKKPEPLDRTLRLAPGQRADILVRGVADSPITLVDADGTLVAPGGGDSPETLVSLMLSSAQAATVEFPLMPVPDLDLPDPSSAVTFRLLMEGGSLSELKTAVYAGERLDQVGLAEVQQVWAFNGIANMPNRPLFQVERGTHVFIEITNRTGWSHAMHLHGHHFKTGSSDAEIEASPWRDTLLVDRNETVTVALLADNPGKWLLHCHMLQHAVAGMSTWFEVT